MEKVRLTMAQALLRFLECQYIAIDGEEHRFVHGLFGIFGHGNVTGLGEALENNSYQLRYYQGHNEQGMAHAAIAFAKQKNRLGIMACTSSIGPGATNMVTAAATATTNRIPLLLLPGDTFSCRQPDPVLQQLEVAHDYTLSVNDCFKPVSKYWDRVARPEQLMIACLNAMRVLTDPAETGAVTLCLPQDVQAESYAYPEHFFEKRVWVIDRPPVSKEALQRAVVCLQKAQKPLIIAGGGVHYSFACQMLADFALAHGIPVAETQAGKSALPANHPMNVGGIGVTGSEPANALAALADCVLVIGSRLQDFTTSSKWAFQNPQCQFIHLNINAMDAYKLASLPLKGDARCGMTQLTHALGHYQTPLDYQHQIITQRKQWQQEIARVTAIKPSSLKALQQTAVLGLLNSQVAVHDVIIGAAGSIPGDLHRLWQSTQCKDYHLEYAYSCMGYEVAAGLGVRLARGSQEGEVYVLVGDGSYLMLHSELLTAIQEDLKITVVIFDNHGYQCIKNLQMAHGSQGFGNEFRYRCPQSGRLEGRYMPINFCQYAEALGAKSFYADTYDGLTKAMCQATLEKISCVFVVPVAPDSMSTPYKSWWRVATAEESNRNQVRLAHRQQCDRLASAKEY